MTGWLEIYLDGICHRASPAGLPLCLRCSAVYGGAGLGLLVEWALVALGRRPGRADYTGVAAGLAAMAIFGGARLVGLFGTPDWLTAASGLWFGWSLAFLATWSSASELGLMRAEGRPGSAQRAVLLAALFVFGAGPAGQPLLRWTALPGLASILVAVNLAVGLVALRALRGRPLRAVVSGCAAVLLVFAELGLFRLWRAVV